MDENTEIEIIRSRRKSLSLEIRPDGRILVRAPKRATDATVREFVKKHKDWLDRHLEQVRKRQADAEQAEKLSEDELEALADQAVAYIPGRVAHYAPLIGVGYGTITIRNQRTRWGSCSGKGNLNFNCLLMLAPPQVIDSVVVHELCHRKEMNHSKRFYEEVLKVFPDYYRWDRWLKENGPSLQARME